MYIVDDICYAGEMKEGIKVTKVKPLRDGMMLVEFSTGEVRLFDVTSLEGETFATLSDDLIFYNPKLFHGVITWNDGLIDISPEMVYEKSYAYNSAVI